MTISLQQLETAATTVWTGMLASTLEPADDAAESPTRMQACVHITGSWNGAVEVRCSKDLARRLSATMAMAEPADLADSDVADAFGEIANLVGGQVKGLIGSGTSLSCPMVVCGDNLTVTHPRLALLHQARFRCAGQPLFISLYANGTSS